MKDNQPAKESKKKKKKGQKLKKGDEPKKDKPNPDLMTGDSFNLGTL